MTHPGQIDAGRQTKERRVAARDKLTSEQCERICAAAAKENPDFPMDAQHRLIEWIEHLRREYEANRRQRAAPDNKTMRLELEALRRHAAALLEGLDYRGNFGTREALARTARLYGAMVDPKPAKGRKWLPETLRALSALEKKLAAAQQQLPKGTHGAPSAKRELIRRLAERLTDGGFVPTARRHGLLCVVMSELVQVSAKEISEAIRDALD